MKKTVIVLLTGLLTAGSLVAANVPPPSEQIAATLLAAPEKRREGAEVLGYNAEGKLVTLRKGSNDLICLADAPANESFSAACYHRDLEPFMARGRELEAQGVTGKERHAMRWKEVDEGRLFMPRDARTLYVLTGKRYDAASGKVEGSYLRWVIYSPYATPETTGLTTEPAPNAPWLMYSGTAGAHIMINPPKAE
jgi:hypothetical protein